MRHCSSLIKSSILASINSISQCSSNSRVSQPPSIINHRHIVKCRQICSQGNKKESKAILLEHLKLRGSAGQPYRILLPSLLHIQPLPHPHVLDALLVPLAHALVRLEPVLAPHLLHPDLRVHEHETAEVDASGSFGRVLHGCNVVVGEGLVGVAAQEVQRGVDEELRDACFAEFFDHGETAEFAVAFFVLVDCGFVFAVRVGVGVRHGNHPNCADGHLGAGADTSAAVDVGVLALGSDFWRMRVCFGGDGGVDDPVEGQLVVIVEFVLEWDALLFYEDLFSDDHGVDEALGDAASWVGGIVLGLISGRAGLVVELHALSQRDDEVDEVAVGGDGHVGQLYVVAGVCLQYKSAQLFSSYDTSLGW